MKCFRTKVFSKIRSEEEVNAEELQGKQTSQDCWVNSFDSTDESEAVENQEMVTFRKIMWLNTVDAISEKEGGIIDKMRSCGSLLQ